MYRLEKDKHVLFRTFDGGDIFVNYDDRDDTISYLENIPTRNNKNPCNLVTLKLNEDAVDIRSRYERKIQLNFEKLNLDFYDQKQGINLEAYLHNGGERVTLVKQG